MATKRRVQIKDGRRGLRYGRDPKPPPGTPRPPPLATQIEQGLDRFRATQPRGTLGLLVPDTPGPLIAAGVPPRAAILLSQRAGRAFFPAASLPAPEPDTLASALIRELRGALVVRDTEAGPVLEVQGRRGLGGLQAIDVVAGDSVVSLTTREELAESHAAWAAAVKRAEGGVYRRERDDPAWVARVLRTLDARGRTTAAGANAPGAIYELFFGPAETLVEVPVSYVQHSDTSRGGSRSSRVRYRTLENVTLADLPQLLARLSRRKRRRGRRLPEQENNPMASLRQYSKGPYGASRSIPASRRNPSHARKAARAKMRKKYGDDWHKSKKARAEFDKMLAGKSPSRSSSSSSRSSSRKKSSGTRKLTAAQIAAGFGGKAAMKGGSKRKSSSKKRSSRKSSSKRALTPAQIAAGFGGKAAMKKARKNHGGKGKHHGRRHADKTHTRHALVPQMRLNGRRKSQGLSRPGALWPEFWHPIYEQAIGQFGVSEALTHGVQPVNRRNPKRKKGKSRKGSSQAKKAMQLLHSGKAKSLKQAWKMVKRS